MLTLIHSDKHFKTLPSMFIYIIAREN